MSPAARADTANIAVTAEPIRSRDGFDVRVVVRLPVRLHDSPIDRAAFAKAVGEGRTVDDGAEQIGRLIKAPIRNAITERTDASAEELLAAADRFAEAAASAARGPLFAAGLMLEGDVTATVDAPALRQRQAEQAAADAARAAADRADDLLRRFEDIRRASPDVPPGRLLMALPPEDRREALLKLFEAAGTKEPGRLMLAAGVRLFEVEGERLRDVAELGELGPIRCLRRINGGDYDLAAGARDGVMLLSTPSWQSSDKSETSRALRARFDAPSPLGFRDVAVASDGWAWATHSALGLAVWRFDATGLQDAFGSEAAAVNGVVTFPGGRVVCGFGPKIKFAIAFADEDGFATWNASCPENEDIYPAVVTILNRPCEPSVDVRAVAVHADGWLSEIELRSFERGESIVIDGMPLERPVTAACGVPWLGDVRVAACVEDGPVVVAGPDDDVRVEYQSEHKGFAAVAASGGRLAAVTGDRQRVVVWNLHEPERPVLDRYVLGETRSRVADVAFL